MVDDHELWHLFLDSVQDRKDLSGRELVPLGLLEAEAGLER